LVGRSHEDGYGAVRGMHLGGRGPARARTIRVAEPERRRLAQPYSDFGAAGCGRDGRSVVSVVEGFGQRHVFESHRPLRAQRAAETQHHLVADGGIAGLVEVPQLSELQAREQRPVERSSAVRLLLFTGPGRKRSEEDEAGDPQTGAPDVGKVQGSRTSSLTSPGGGIVMCATRLPDWPV